jgi:para-aminobenzoate synthetase component I
MTATPSHSSSSPQSPTLTDWPGVVSEQRAAVDPRDAFVRLCHLPHCIFFDSALRDPQLGRYSFIAADPFEFHTADPDDRAAWSRIAERLAAFAKFPTAVGDDQLPPFKGGAAGLFSYDLGRSLERLPKPKFDEFTVPGLAIGLYDTVVAFDHATHRSWIISQGFPETDPAARNRRAEQRAKQFQSLLDAKDAPGIAPAASNAAQVPIEQTAPRFSVTGVENLTSNFAEKDYLAMVSRGIEYVYAGDVFQVNLAQRLLHPATDDSVSLYLRLRQRNPATFSAYFDLGEFQIVSASPERFLQVRDRQVEARPIKGTRRRTARPEADLFAGDDLQESEKDRAENVMIVDLLRNDLSRVCLPESVVVSELCRLERYEFVQHLVSVVQGRLRDEFGPLDLLRSSFPGGSVTGAPKVRAMEIIAELEPTARGPYCGSLGYLGFDGTMDTSILIRTITAGRGWWQFPVGGGITAKSDPEREYEETWHKAEGLIRSIA